MTEGDEAIPTPVVIADEGGDYLKISPTRRSHPAATDYWDANWLDCSIEFRTGGFRGTIAGSLRTDELDSFNEALTQTYEDRRSPASFADLDGHLQIEIRGDGLGHLTAECAVAQNAGTGPEVRFEWSKHERHRRWWPSIMAVIAGWMLLVSALLSREEASSVLAVDAIATAGGTLIVVGLFQLGRRIFSTG